MPLPRDVTNRSAKLAKLANTVAGLPVFDTRADLSNKLLVAAEQLKDRFSLLVNIRDNPQQMISNFGADETAYSNEMKTWTPVMAKAVLTQVVTHVACSKLTAEMFTDLCECLRITRADGVLWGFTR